jgi:uncharacterized protein YPO0396
MRFANIAVDKKLSRAVSGVTQEQDTLGQMQPSGQQAFRFQPQQQQSPQQQQQSTQQQAQQQRQALTQEIRDTEARLRQLRQQLAQL